MILLSTMKMVSLYLMTQKGYDVLNYIIGRGYSAIVDCVVSSADASIEKDYYIEIKSLCESANIIFYDRKSVIDLRSEYSIAVSWRWIISSDSKLIVLHDSILPKYRGFAPLVNSLKNGEPFIGVTALFASNEYDKGDIICIDKLAVVYPIKIADAINSIVLCYFNCIDYIFERFLTGTKLNSVTQGENEATYSLWLDDLDYKIDWSRDSDYIKRFVDSTGWPYANAYTNIGNDKLKVVDVDVVNDVVIENRTPGKVIFVVDSQPIVVCGSGLIKINQMLYDNGQNAIPLKKFRTRFD